MNKFFLLSPFLALHLNLNAAQKMQSKNFGTLELPKLSSTVIKMVKGNKGADEMYGALLANGDYVIARHHLTGQKEGTITCEHRLVDLHGNFIDMPPYTLDPQYYFLFKKMYETAE